MSVTHVVGVDPGLVHTGVVRIKFDPKEKLVGVASEAVVGPDADAVRQWVFRAPKAEPPHIFIEKYQPRSHLNTDARMGQAVQDMHRVLPGSKVLLNTGVKKVIAQPLMELLGVWRFTTTTHHQDLRSAARIALFGMVKDEALNTVLADVVRDHLAGRSWDVYHF